MVHTAKYCPHCGTLVANNATVFSGSPVRICPKCGEYFIDTAFKEPAFYDAPTRMPLWKILLYLFWPFGFATVLMLVIAIVAVDHIAGLLLPVIPLIPYLYVVFVGFKNKNKIYQMDLQEYQASKERLAYKDYVTLLLDHKCFVPRYYLSVYHRDLLDYTPTEGHIPTALDQSFTT